MLNRIRATRPWILTLSLIVSFAMISQSNCEVPPQIPPPPPTTTTSDTTKVEGTITNILMSKDIKGDELIPIDVTSTFPADTKVYHTVVTIFNAPANTSYKAVWFAPDNSKITEYELKADGSRNIDFNIRPTTPTLPVGKYRVDIYVNGTIDHSIDFNVVDVSTVNTPATTPTTTPTPTTVTNTPMTTTPTTTTTPTITTPTMSPQATAPSNILSDVIMAEDTKGDTKDPVNPTSEFKTISVIHAVVQIQNAPANTKIKAVWYVTDVGTAAPANTLIDSVDISTEGTRNIDFTLKPTTTWPVGSYRVEIQLNGVTHTVKSFTVK